MRNIVILTLLLLGLSMLAGGAMAADESKGRAVYELHCATCHGSNGVSPDPMVPNFADGEALFLMDGDLLKRISDGSNTMPAFRGLLSAEEMRNVIAYIRTF